MSTHNIFIASLIFVCKHSHSEMTMEETGFWLDAEMHIFKCNFFVLLIHNTSAHVARGKTGCGHGQLYKIMEATTETF